MTIKDEMRRPPYYIRNIFDEDEIERFCIMTVDGVLSDSAAVAEIRRRKTARRNGPETGVIEMDSNTD